MRSPIIQAIPALFLVLGLLFSAAICQEVEDEKEFSYVEGSANGPEKWGELHPEWAICNNGEMQSPIDLIDDRMHVLHELGELNTSYRASNATLRNRGHDITLEWSNNTAGSIYINGTEYFLQQCHWHSPSEHTINHQRFALEVHMVHQSSNNNTAVVGIMYKIGQPDTFLSELEEHIEEIAEKKEAQKNVGSVDPSHLKVGSGKYYRYMGSLTTPACTEGVTWSIIGEIRTASKEQVKLLREAVADDAENNARPTQPINEREIYFYTPELHRK